MTAPQARAEREKTGEFFAQVFAGAELEFYFQPDY